MVDTTGINNNILVNNVTNNNTINNNKNIGTINGNDIDGAAESAGCEGNNNGNNDEEKDKDLEELKKNNDNIGLGTKRHSTRQKAAPFGLTRVESFLN